MKLSRQQKNGLIQLLTMHHRTIKDNGGKMTIGDVRKIIANIPETPDNSLRAKWKRFWTG